jgi:hypothetical protein
MFALIAAVIILIAALVYGAILAISERNADRRSAVAQLDAQFVAEWTARRIERSFAEPFTN